MSGTSVYSFRWKSKMPSSIWQGVKQGVKSIWDGLVDHLFSIANIVKGIGKKVLVAVGAACVVAGVVTGVTGVFKESKMNAKVAGALLACSLALREPFQSQSISIVAFSLGNQVMKTCLKTLAELGANDVI